MITKAKFETELHGKPVIGEGDIVDIDGRLVVIDFRHGGDQYKGKFELKTIQNPECVREFLVNLCECGVVNENFWRNRDTPGAQLQLYQAWGLLKAGCNYELMSPISDGTISINIEWLGFSNFENGTTIRENCESFYIPTSERLAEAKGDWY